MDLFILSFQRYDFKLKTVNLYLPNCKERFTKRKTEVITLKKVFPSKNIFIYIFLNHPVFCVLSASTSDFKVRVSIRKSVTRRKSEFKEKMLFDQSAVPHSD